MHTTGVDFDKRCQKYRVRLTRNGIVYLIAYTTTLSSACKKRKEALEKYNSNESFDFLHSYETSSRRKKLEEDDYLFKLGLSNNHSSPYRSLLVAVLMQAIKDCLSLDVDIKTQAKQWLESNARNTLQFSLIDICDELSIKPDKVKELIKSSEREKKQSRTVVGRRLVRSTKTVDK